MHPIVLSTTTCNNVLLDDTVSIKLTGLCTSIGSGLNWLRTKPCDGSSTTQKFTYDATKATLTAQDGRCVGVESHWLWAQPMVSLVGCGGAKSNLTLQKPKGTIATANGFGCLGVSNVQGPPSSL